MITVLRFIALLVLYAMSVLMITAILHAFDNWGFMGPDQIDLDKFLSFMPWPAGLLGAVIIIMSTPIGDMIIGLFLATRKQTLRDEEKLSPILGMLKDRYKEKFGLSIHPKTLVMDLPGIDGLAYGRRAMAVSTGLLKTAQDEEIAGILAHEIGHLHHRDGFFNIAFLVASIPFYTIQYFLGGVVFSMFIRDEKSDGGDFLFSLVLAIVLVAFLAYHASIFLGLWVIGWPIIGAIILLQRSIQWPIEYKADRFAAEMGFAPALISLFERIEDEDVRGQEGFLAKYAYSHPPTALRIDRLERYLLQHNQ